MSGIDWGGWMRAGIRDRGLTPREFWALSPAELMLMLGREGVEPPMSRARLEDMARQWPDTKEHPDG